MPSSSEPVRVDGPWVGSFLGEEWVVTIRFYGGVVLAVLGVLLAGAFVLSGCRVSERQRQYLTRAEREDREIRSYLSFLDDVEAERDRGRGGTQGWGRTDAAPGEAAPGEAGPGEGNRSTEGGGRNAGEEGACEAASSPGWERADRGSGPPPLRELRSRLRLALDEPRAGAGGGLPAELRDLLLAVLRGEPTGDTAVRPPRRVRRRVGVRLRRRGGRRRGGVRDRGSRPSRDRTAAGTSAGAPGRSPRGPCPPTGSPWSGSAWTDRTPCRRRGSPITPSGSSTGGTSGSTSARPASGGSCGGSPPSSSSCW